MITATRKIPSQSSAMSPVVSSRLAARRALKALWIAALLVSWAAPDAGVAGGDSRWATDTREAASLLAGAESGDSWAQLNLGAAFDHGMAGFEPDPKRAVFWYRRAAVAGLAMAQFNLAHCLATGSGTGRNDEEALDWMLKAAKQGLPEAQFLAGVMLAEGVGTRPNSVLAKIWLRRAAGQGNPDAASLLRRIEEASATE